MCLLFSYFSVVRAAKYDFRRKKMREISAVHYHSPYLYDCALELAKCQHGISAVIASVVAVESLLGDIRLTYATRHGVASQDSRSQTSSKLIDSLFKSHVSRSNFALTDQELAVLRIIEPKTTSAGNVNRKPALNLFYQLLGCARGERRSPSDFTRNNQRELLYDDIVDLFDLRHAIVHRDGAAFVFSEERSIRNHGVPEAVLRLRELNIISDQEFGATIGWLNLIDNAAVAKWSVSVSGNFIKYVLDNLPDGQGSEYLRANARP